MNDYFSKWCCLICFNPSQGYLQHLQFDSSIHFTKHLYSFQKSNPIDKHPPKGFNNFLISGDDLGEQMQNAFKNAFDQGFRKVVMIRSDFDLISFQQIIEAFSCLKFIEFCIGPKENGDYYLIGMNYFEPILFNNKQWDSPTLTKETIKDIGKLKLALYKLPTLKTEKHATALNT